MEFFHLLLKAHILPRSCLALTMYVIIIIHPPHHHHYLHSYHQHHHVFCDLHHHNVIGSTNVVTNVIT